MKTYLSTSNARPCALCGTFTNAYVRLHDRRLRVCGDCRLHRPWREALRGIVKGKARVGA